MAEQSSLPDVLARMYENQLAIEAALMELVLLEEQRGSSETCDNARVALDRGYRDNRHRTGCIRTRNGDCRAGGVALSQRAAVGWAAQITQPDAPGRSSRGRPSHHGNAPKK